MALISTHMWEINTASAVVYCTVNNIKYSNRDILYSGRLFSQRNFILFIAYKYCVALTISYVHMYEFIIKRPSISIIYHFLPNMAVVIYIIFFTYGLRLSYKKLWYNVRWIKNFAIVLLQGNFTKNARIQPSH